MATGGDYVSLIERGSSGTRADVTPIFANPTSFSLLVDDLTGPFCGLNVKLVAGIEALGFILGTAIARKLDIGFIAIRKGGKIPGAVDSKEFVDYSGTCKRLELKKGSVPAGAEVLLVDEWVETGTQVLTAAELLERSGGVIVGVCAISIDDNERTRVLRERYVCHSALSSGVRPRAKGTTKSEWEAGSEKREV